MFDIVLSMFQNILSIMPVPTMVLILLYQYRDIGVITKPNTPSDLAVVLIRLNQFR